MPRWNVEQECYEEEKGGVRDDYEERFRTALLNELDALTAAVRCLDKGGFRVRTVEAD